MSITRKIWTEEEEKVLLSQVKANPQNLQLAFELTSKEIDRSSKACSLRWYKYLSKKEDTTNTCFFTISKEKIGRNRKNSKDSFTKPKLSKWKRILNILFK